MKRQFKFLLYTILFTGLTPSCDSKPEVDLDEIPIDTELQRFEQAFYSWDTADIGEGLTKLSEDFRPFFSSKTEPIFWVNQRTDTQNLKLYELSDKVFPSESPELKALNSIFKRYYYYFGATDTLEVYSYISSLDFNYPIVYSQPYLFIALDLYLGKPAEEFYQVLPQYLQYGRQASFLNRDVAYALSLNHVPPPPEPVSLLDAMIYHGKLLKLTELLLGEVQEANLLVYPPEKHQFSVAHEKDMWVYFIENQLLFKSDQDLQRRFIEVAPFSKFRTELDVQTPGRIGRWFGYRIMDAYLDAYPEQSLDVWMRETDSRKLLRLSGYKP